MLLYRRSALQELWNEIQEDTLEYKAQLWIVGAPGAGRSCAAFAFACGVVDRREWTVLWIHYSSASRTFSYIKFENDQRFFYTTDARRVGSVSELEVLVSSLEKDRKTIGFFDGYNSADPKCEAALTILRSWRHKNISMRRLVCVTSMVSVGKKYKRAQLPVFKKNAPTTSRQNRSGCIRSSMLFRVASWTLENYLAAIQDNDFFVSVESCFRSPAEPATPLDAQTPQEDRVALVRRKHFVAGGSARAMFSQSVAETVEDLRDAVDRVSSLFAVDRLQAYYDAGGNTASFDTRVVSSIAAKMLAVRVGPDAILELASVLDVDPSMESQLLEAWVLASVAKSVLQYKLRGLPEVKKYWKRQLVELFDPGTTPISDSGCWYVSTRWNEGGYDSLYLEYNEAAEASGRASAAPSSAARMRIVFLQMTRSNDHNYASDSFCQVLHMLGENRANVGSAELWYIVPQENLPSFNCPVDQATFKRQVIDNAFPSTGTGCQVDCAVRVAGVAHPMNH